MESILDFLVKTGGFGVIVSIVMCGFLWLWFEYRLKDYITSNAHEKNSKELTESIKKILDEKISQLEKLFEAKYNHA